MGSNEKNLIGVYQCHPEDDIKNFKIRVKIWKITTDNKDKEENYDFKWQEKVFSMQEIDLYKDVSEANATDHEKQCKKLLDQWKQMRHKKLQEHRLYSLVDDEIAMESEEKDHVTDYESEKLTATEAAFREAQKTQADDGASSQQRSAGPQSAASVLTSNLDRHQFLRQFFTAPKTQRMRVMFDYRPSLGPPAAVEAPVAEAANATDNTQKLLCTVAYNPRDRLLTLQPDFTKNPLIVGNWRYTIENISIKMSEAERSRILSQEKERIKLKAESKQIFRPIDFEMPTQPLRVLIRGEIMTAKHFEYNYLYVHFFLDLTPDWFATQASGLSGTTQICSTKVEEVFSPVEKKDDIAHFSYPFEFELFYERLVPPGKDDYTFPKWPVLYFEVMSQDTWTRHRTEGYSYLTLPNTPGVHSYKLQCWRPTGNSVVCELRRFFIGGTPELEDSTFANVPTDFDGSHLSKYGFNTETTGELTVRLHAIHQSAQFTERRAAGGGAMSGAFAAGQFSTAGPSYADLNRALNRFRTARTQLVMVQKSSTLTQQLLTAAATAAAADEPPRPAPRRRRLSSAQGSEDGVGVGGVGADPDRQRIVSFGPTDSLTEQYKRHIEANEE